MHVSLHVRVRVGVRVRVRLALPIVMSPTKLSLLNGGSALATTFAKLFSSGPGEIPFLLASPLVST